MKSNRSLFVTLSAVQFQRQLERMPTWAKARAGASSGKGFATLERMVQQILEPEPLSLRLVLNIPKLSQELVIAIAIRAGLTPNAAGDRWTRPTRP